MLEVDLHSHSIFSLCGMHTIIELLTKAKELGMKALAVTDHGKTLGGRVSSVFFERLKDPVPGIKLLKGIEANIIDTVGNTDVPGKFIRFMDIILLGLHPNVKYGLGRKCYTDMLVAAIEKNPFIDIITHPNDEYFPVDFDILAETAKKNNTAIELNNSKIMLKRVSIELTEEMLYACRKKECLIAVNSDAHTINEVGINDYVLPLLSKTEYPDELIINRNYDTAMEFIQTKKEIKKKYK
jgi:putative hydrolase